MGRYVKKIVFQKLNFLLYFETVILLAYGSFFGKQILKWPNTPKYAWWFGGCMAEAQIKWCPLTVGKRYLKGTRWQKVP